MMSICAGYAGYPYTAPGSCMTTCGGFTTAQQRCYPYFAGLATNTTGMTRQHNCEHAWGSDDSECPP